MRGIPVPSRFEKDSHDYLDVVMTMIDFLTPKILAHRRNLERYARLLATQLTDLEREYIHKRIAEEQAELERWDCSMSHFIPGCDNSNQHAHSRL